MYYDSSQAIFALCVVDILHFVRFSGEGNDCRQRGRFSRGHMRSKPGKYTAFRVGLHPERKTGRIITDLSRSLGLFTFFRRIVALFWLWR